MESASQSFRLRSLPPSQGGSISIVLSSVANWKLGIGGREVFRQVLNSRDFENRKGFGNTSETKEIFNTSFFEKDCYIKLSISFEPLYLWE